MYQNHWNPIHATADILGSREYPQLHGCVCFRQMPTGVLVTAELFGLPYRDACHSGVFAFHIHNGESCTGNAEAPFADAGTHWNPNGCPHPYHAGDLPPLFGNHGYAYLSTFTDRFTIEQLLGKVIIVHEMPDDFTSQPSGNSGKKIACGSIR